jgi:hypothetical protein
VSAVSIIEDAKILFWVGCTPVSCHSGGDASDDECLGTDTLTGANYAEAMQYVSDLAVMQSELLCPGITTAYVWRINCTLVEALQISVLILEE